MLVTGRPETARTPMDVCADVVAALMREGRGTRNQIGKRVFPQSKSGAYRIGKHIKALHDRGVVYIQDWLHGRYEVWAMQPRPFFFADAPRPDET